MGAGRKVRFLTNVDGLILKTSRVVPDEELNLVLVKMLEFLGHRNMIVSAVAFNEVGAIYSCLPSSC
jgi:hypothetical protein